jgi:hypothetical protein
MIRLSLSLLMGAPGGTADAPLLFVIEATVVACRR